ncbi:hypothetical protein C8R45DRAFT_1221997 [Mycena sanguinolenta]|nr:hypothetical protein C8R45DRAFT_1221997 [Mycena sanguinolenta]
MSKHAPVWYRFRSVCVERLGCALRYSLTGRGRVGSLDDSIGTTRWIPSTEPLAHCLRIVPIRTSPAQELRPNSTLRDTPDHGGDAQVSSPCIAWGRRSVGDNSGENGAEMKITPAPRGVFVATDGLSSGCGRRGRILTSGSAHRPRAIALAPIALAIPSADGAGSYFPIVHSSVVLAPRRRTARRSSRSPSPSHPLPCPAAQRPPSASSLPRWPEHSLSAPCLRAVHTYSWRYLRRLLSMHSSNLDFHRRCHIRPRGCYPRIFHCDLPPPLPHASADVFVGKTRRTRWCTGCAAPSQAVLDVFSAGRAGMGSGWALLGRIERSPGSTVYSCLLARFGRIRADCSLSVSPPSDCRYLLGCALLAFSPGSRAAFLVFPAPPKTPLIPYQQTRQAAVDILCSDYEHEESWYAVPRTSRSTSTTTSVGEHEQEQEHQTCTPDPGPSLAPTAQALTLDLRGGRGTATATAASASTPALVCTASILLEP